MEKKQKKMIILSFLNKVKDHKISKDRESITAVSILESEI